ncbi:MAG: SdpI family protein [Anaerolineae bacterium]|nr:SdpI family protein [Anaerolineae bacterium]
METLFLVNAGIGILMIVLAIPMALQKVKPNFWYGFRTRKTLSDESVWYAANQYAGKALLLAGSVIVVGAMILYWLARSAQYGAYLGNLMLFALWMILWVVPLAGCVIASLVHLKKL